jgi:Cu+-exporting ATPase
MTIDPVCGMQVDEKTAQWKATHGDRTFYFCSSTCRDKFKANPEKYVAEVASAEKMPTLP